MSRKDANAALALSCSRQGGNAPYIDDIYAGYEKDPASVDPEWQEFFRSMKDQPGYILKNAEGPSWSRDNWPLTPRDELTSALDGNWAQVEKSIGAKLAAKPQAKGAELTPADVHQATRDSVRALMLIRAYRMRGHFHAKLDPLGIEPPRDRQELDPRSYGLVGAESLIPALEQIIKRGGNLGVKEIVVGMRHRGRLNVLTQVMGKPHRALFHEFKGGSANPDAVEGSGDVKYHLGASSDREFDNNRIHLSLTANPSHLEIVDPVVLGKVRAKQAQHGDPPDHRISVLPLLMHGDAAFAGQGVVAECFSLSDLKGYRTRGSPHFIVNNQIGFTPPPRYSRSSPYPSDVAKMIDAPIFHVNGDDPEAVVFAAKVAIEFRQKFHKPVVIDMFCYRRHGHNEGDEPAFTQPVMYKKIATHPSTLDIYSRRLIAEGVMTDCEVEKAKADWRARLDAALEAGSGCKPHKADRLHRKRAGLKSARQAEDPRPP